MARFACVMSLLTGLLFAEPALLHAQPVDAGALRQQIERELPAPLPGRAAPLQAAEPGAPLALPDGATVTVRSFRLDGNRLLADETLQAALQSYRDRALGFAELQQAVQAVTEAYQQAGWLVRAFLPRQDVTEGVVTIRIVEASFAGARVQPPAPTRVDESMLVARLQARQAVGEPLSVERLDRALLLADDLPGIAVTGALGPGTSAGSTAVALTAVDTPLVSGEVGADNGGSRATGAARLTLSASLNSPLRRGDQARVDLAKTEGSEYLRAAYALPVGLDGWRVGISASALKYHLVGEDFRGLGARGRSSGVGVDASWPLVRARAHNLYLNLGWDAKRYRNDANQAVQSDYRIGAGTVGLSGNRFDARGVTSFNLAVNSGRVELGGLDAGEQAARGGRFNKLRYGVTRQQVIAPTLSLMAALSGQHANRDLDSSERFYLGGPAGVRAYPVNEGSGSRGQLLNLELRWNARPSLTVSAFYDWGRVSQAGGSASPAVASTQLKGAGVALAWAGPRGVDVRAAVATRIGDNPNALANGHDQDGSLRRARVWLQMSVPF